MKQLFKLSLLVALISSGYTVADPSYTLAEVCDHYTDSQANCARIPFCRHERGSAFCEKISGPNSPYACQIFNNNPQACNQNTFGNCRWNAGQPRCSARRPNL